MKRPILILLTAALLAAAAPALAASPKQGGAATITFSSDLTTLDPQVGYDWQNWSVIKAMFNGLMDYKPGTTELVPDLAESFTVNSDGTIYTFKLRQGVKFHNGRVMTSADVKYSFEHALDPKTQCPGASYFSSIKGADDVIAGKTKDLAGLTLPDANTVIFTLNHPDATFLHLMAINFGFVIPKEAVEAAGADWGKKPVGTGAFKFVEWVPGQHVTLERNKDFYIPGVPYVDKINFEFGQDPTVAVLRLKKGEVDIVGDGIPPAQFAEIQADPANKDLVAAGDQLHTGYVTMNVKMPPFDNIKVRQAVNMAINKERIVKLINGRAASANQALPPSMPGFNKDQKGFAYDIEGARKLLADAGQGAGFTTELYVMNVDPNPRIAQAIQQDLAAVGITAEIKSLAQAEVIAAAGSGKAPMVWSGGMAWIADFPDPATFYYAILGCGGAADGGWNWSKYCNEALDKRAAAADTLGKPEQTAERMKAWSGIFDDIVTEAPWVPVFNEKRFTYHSARLGGDPSLYTDPIHIPVNYEYIFAKDAQ